MEEKPVKPAKKFVRPKKVSEAAVVEAPAMELVVVAPITDAPVKKTRAKKTVVKAAAAPAVVPAVIPVVPAVIPKKFNPRKKAVAPVKPIIGIVEAKPLDDVTVEKITVRKTDIGGRALYVSSKKDKVYDLKFKYIGRWNRREDAVDTSYADSDGEA